MLKMIRTGIVVLIAAIGKPAAAANVFVEFNPQLLFLSGYGGTLGVEVPHLQLGMFGASTVLPDSFRDSFFNNAQNTNVKNSLLEVGANIYWSADNSGLYTGLLYGPEWFRIKSDSSGAQTTIKAYFLAGRVGYRYFFGDRFYMDGGLGYGSKVGGDSNATIDSNHIQLKSSDLLSFFATGVRF